MSIGSWFNLGVSLSFCKLGGSTSPTETNVSSSGYGSTVLRGAVEPGSERRKTANWWNLWENSFFFVCTCTYDDPCHVHWCTRFRWFHVCVFSLLFGEDFHVWLILVETTNQCIHPIFASSWFARRAVPYRHQRVYFPIPIFMGATKPAQKNNSQQPPSSLLGSIMILYIYICYMLYMYMIIESTHQFLYVQYVLEFYGYL